jgi:hypothetical protein
MDLKNPFAPQPPVADPTAAQFVGSIVDNVLTLKGAPSVGQIVQGAVISGDGVAPDTVVGPGSGLSWKVSPSQKVGPLAMTATLAAEVTNQVAFEHKYAGRLDLIERQIEELLGIAKGDSASLAVSSPAAGVSLPAGKVGVAYVASLAATRGTLPYSWAVSAGTLPAGLSLNAATGAITGTPTVAVAAAPLTFGVKDASSQSASIITSLTIAA